MWSVIAWRLCLKNVNIKKKRKKEKKKVFVGPA